MHRTLFATCLFMLMLSFGCYETKFTLSPPESAKVDRSFVGDFEQFEVESKATFGVGERVKDAVATTKATKDKIRLSVRNLDDRHYFAEWIEIPETGTSDKAPLRMIAFTTDVKGATFVHLRELTADGEVPEKHLIMRIALSADKNTLTLRSLSEEFFKQQTIESDEQLRKIVEDHLNDDAMYDKEPATMTRVPTQK